MSSYTLILDSRQPNGYFLPASLELPLYEDLAALHEPKILGTANHYVYSDLIYSAQLQSDDDPSIIDDVTVYINGYLQSSGYEEGWIFKNKRIFSDNFGMIQLSIHVKFKSSEKLILYTPFLSVYISISENNDSIQRMAEYIYQKQPLFLFQNEKPSLDTNGLKPATIKELSSQIQILNKIVFAYDENSRYFRLNAKFKLAPQKRVDNFEKAKVVTASTIQYIVEHPDQFTPCHNTTGIKVNRRQYLPTKALIIENTHNYNIYENQILVGFLSSLHKAVYDLIDQINTRIISYTVPSNNLMQNGYILSTVLLFNIGYHRLIDAKKQLQHLLIRIEELFNLYSTFFKVTPQNVQTIPKPSEIFMSIKPYRIIFDLIVEWFQYGIYDFSREDLLLPLLKSCKIYEYYSLLQLCDYFLHSNYQLISSEAYSYYIPNAFPFPEVISTLPNTFYFSHKESGKRITLYYEPLIHSDRTYIGENGIGLYRNNSVSLNQRSGSYYLPDYLIKIEHGDFSDYIIMDAKFSRLSNVKKFYFPQLTYKYIFSVSPIDPTDKLLGLYVFSGKISPDESKDSVTNFYDFALPSNTIFPVAKIITLTERLSNDPNHHELLAQAFDGIL